MKDRKARAISPAPAMVDYAAMPVGAIRIEGGLRCKGRNSRISEDELLVTIITPVFNAERTLEQTIQSVLNQTFDNIEYIIIDGGSQDSSLDIIRKYDNEVDYWISERDRGIADAFNKGISLATGNIIAILNADDWYEPHTVRRAVEVFRSGGADIVHGMLRYWPDIAAPELLHGDHVLLNLEMLMHHPTTFVARRVYEDIGLFRPEFLVAMDYEWLLRARTEGVRFVYLNECMANMRSGGTSIQHWYTGLRECLAAKDMYSPGFSNKVYFVFSFVKTSIYNLLVKRFGLNSLAGFYPLILSVISKRKERRR